MQKEKINTENLMKIGELAKAADISLSTLKYYVKEGMIVPVCKTGKNMSWYDPGSVEIIRTIRMLQRERFYPLSVIKHFLQSPAANWPPELALLDAIHKVNHRGLMENCSLTEAAQHSRLTIRQVHKLAEAGLVGDGGKKQTFSAYDLSVLELVRKRLEAGIPFRQTLLSFSSYAAALRQAVQADVDSFVQTAMLEPELTAAVGVRRILVSDETLDYFVGLTRQKFNRICGSEYLELLYGFFDNLELAFNQLPQTLEQAGYGMEAQLCAAAEEGKSTGDTELDLCARQYVQCCRWQGGVVAEAIKELIAWRKYFSELEGGSLPVRCLHFLWLRLAPDILTCGEAAQRAAAQIGDPALCEQLEKLPQRL